MKKLILLAMLILTAFASNAYDFEADGIYYEIIGENNVGVVRGDVYYSGDIVIPETVGYNGATYSTTTISKDAFRDCTDITSVTIPNSVTSIGDHAFYKCSGVTSVTIGNSVTSIGDWAFYACFGLTEITIPNSVTSIGDYAFYDCSGLTSVTIPNSVSSIGKDAFSWCSGLTSVTIGNSVTSIGDHAFYKCSGVTSVTIGNSVTSIGDWAFYACFGLTEITIPNSVTSIGDYAFYDCSGLTSVTIPNSVSSIGKDAFSWCSGLTSVTIGNSVTSIGEGAFKNCKSLISIISLNQEPPTLGSMTFYECPIEAVEVPIEAVEAYKAADGWKDYNIVAIGDTTYEHVEGVQIGDLYYNLSKDGTAEVTSKPSGKYSGYIVIPETVEYNEAEYTVTAIGEAAFAYCSSLKSVEIPSSLTKINSRAFYRCTSLETVEIPSSVTLLDATSFGSCKSLKEINVSAENKNYATLNGVLYDINITELICCPGGKAQVEIPSTVTKIQGWAFSGCVLLTSVELPSSVIQVGDRTFDGCTSLKEINVNAENRYYCSVDGVLYNKDITELICCPIGKTQVEIPSTVTKIQGWAFQECESLKSIKIPVSVISIGFFAFAYCWALTTVYSLNPVPPTINSYGFYECPIEAVDVPQEAVDAYKAADVWKDYNIVAIGDEDENDEDGKYPRKVYCEEFTGTWCGWCPRGYVAMETMRDNYPDDWIGVAMHWSDKMSVPTSETSDLFEHVTGVPDSYFNRDFTNSYYGSLSAMKPAYNKIVNKDASAGISVSAAYDSKNFYVTSESEFGFDAEPNMYTLEYLIKEDNVGPYIQTNYYYSGSGRTLEWWDEQDEYVQNIYYNDVLRCRKIYDDAFSESIAKGSPITYSATIEIPEGVDCKNTQVVALIIDNETGIVLNAACANATSGVSSPIVDDIENDADAEYFTLQGVRVVGEPKPGLYIKRVGSTASKVLVK